MTNTPKPNTAQKAPLVRAPKPIDLGADHPYVLLPDGRVAKICKTTQYGRQQRVHITVNGVRKQVALYRVQAALTLSNPKNK